MRAAVLKDWVLRTDDIPDPTPGPGQVLTRVLACGICGSDQRLVHHGAELQQVRRQFDHETLPFADGPMRFDPDADTVLGHEFCCEVVGVGAGVTNLRAGDVVVSLPLTFDADGTHSLGFSNRYPGGFGELMVLNELYSTRVPHHVPPTLATMTEPLAVGIHAIHRGGVRSGDSALVHGLGPVGLAIVAALKLAGIGPIIASDPSPVRRALAEQLGCDVVVDPAVEQPFAAWQHASRSAPMVAFDAVGLPGSFDRAMRMAPAGSRVVIVGACLHQDAILPIIGLERELTLLFARGYEPAEFTMALQAISAGHVDLAPLISATVGIEGVPGAIASLDPIIHGKFVVEATTQVS